MAEELTPQGAESVEGESIELDPSTDASVAPILQQIAMVMPGFVVPKFRLTKAESNPVLTCECGDYSQECATPEDVIQNITRHVASHFGLEGII